MDISSVDRIRIARPLRADAERNRQRILTAAEEVFAARGLEAGLDEIARHAGVGTGTVYRRFPDKASLIDALFERRFEALIALGEEAAAVEDSWQGLVRFLEGAAELTVADRGFTDLLFSHAYCHEPLAGRRHEVMEIVAGLLERAQRDGYVRADVTETDLPMVQLMLDVAGAFSGMVERQLWRRYLGLLLDGLRVARSAPSPLPAGALTRAQFDEAIARSGCHGHLARHRPPGG